MKRSKLALTFALALVMFGASAQISQQALIDSMIANHGRIKSALLNEEILRIQSKQTWNLPTTDFNLQQGQINASNWDYFFTISQSFEGIWQKNSLKKWVQTQGKRTNIEKLEWNFISGKFNRRYVQISLNQLQITVEQTFFKNQRIIIT